MVKESKKVNILILCECGCDNKLWKYNKQGRETRFIIGHNSRIRKHSEETKLKISKSGKGLKRTEETRKKMSSENNHNWKGDDVSYTALHKWIKRHFPKPEKCQLCQNVPPMQLACITNIYNRELKNWAWFCIRCHQKWDNIGIRNKIKRNIM
jgi:phage gpG-like protein